MPHDNEICSEKIARKKQQKQNSKKTKISDKALITHISFS